MGVYRGFQELEVFIDGDYVHFRQNDDRDSWVKIPRLMWAAVASDIDKEIADAVMQEASA